MTDRLPHARPRAAYGDFASWYHPSLELADRHRAHALARAQALFDKGQSIRCIALRLDCDDDEVLEMLGLTETGPSAA